MVASIGAHLPAWGEISETFNESVRSVGTAVTLAGVGMYLHRRNFLSSDGKRTLALISQQVTFPLFLFTRILYCNQDWSDEPCPNVISSLEDVWMLVLWPFVCVGLGILVGWGVTKVAHTPRDQVRIALAATGFGNSTGLPITLLTVVHANFPASSDLGAMDPTLFLSIYLLLYPVLQWGVGGWLLAPVETGDSSAVRSSSVRSIEKTTTHSNANDELTQLASSTGDFSHSNLSNGGQYFVQTSDSPIPSACNSSSRNLLLHNVLHNTDMSNFYVSHRHGLVSTDEGMYMSEFDLTGLAQGQIAAAAEEKQDDDKSLNSIPRTNLSLTEESNDYEEIVDCEVDCSEKANSKRQQISTENEIRPNIAVPTVQTPLLLVHSITKDHSRRSIKPVPSAYEVNSFSLAISNIASRCLQPPVVGALLGLMVAMLPQLRGLLVDLEHRRSKAPLEWMFDGLYSVGQTAVPINMMILGANLSAAYRKETMSSPCILDRNTLIGILVGKMIVLPIVGISLSLFLRQYVLNIPDAIDASFYLVLMIVFLCPTANNVMVMVELTGSDNLKEGLAQAIALQYIVAPAILSVTMTVAVGCASGWS